MPTLPRAQPMPDTRTIWPTVFVSIIATLPKLRRESGGTPSSLWTEGFSVVSKYSRRTHWTTVFAKFVRRSKTKEQAQLDLQNGETPVMNESALASYLTSTYNVPIKDVPANFTLDRPLHEYYISSSHNTYLLGRQVAGQSSVEAYISALSKACRCVEVDCWDGSEGPVVMHGRTLTSQVSFADVMTTISKYAFVSSQFPLLISLEVHCSRQQQIMMAEIIKATCGSKLVTEPLDPNTQQLPSPSQLMNRILIKVKMPSDEPAFNAEMTAGRRRGASVNSPYVRPTVLDNCIIPNASILQSPPMSPRQRPTLGITRSQTINVRVTQQAGGSQDSLSNSTSESESMNDDGSEKRKQQSNIVKVLGDLGVYTAGVKFHGFDAPESKTYNHIYSFMEATFTKNSKTPDTKRALVRHNMRHMMRVYPNGWRVASTNFEPAHIRPFSSFFGATHSKHTPIAISFYLPLFIPVRTGYRDGGGQGTPPTCLLRAFRSRLQ